MLSRHRKRRGEKFVNENMTLMYPKVNICKKKKLHLYTRRLLEKYIL